jgi:hypothetical protein
VGKGQDFRKGSALLALTSGASDIKRLLGDIDREYSLTHPITKVIQTCNTAPHRALLYTGSAACRVPRYCPAYTAEQEKTGPQLSNWLSCSATIWMRSRIASPEMLPKDLSLPQLKCSPAVDSRGSRDEAGEHGDQE